MERGGGTNGCQSFYIWKKLCCKYRGRSAKGVANDHRGTFVFLF